jgi:hypothetical protein
MKKIVLILLLVVLLTLTSCAKAVTDDSYNTTTAPKTRVDIGGNWSFIDLNHLDGAVSDNVTLVANAISAWEMNNPDREIVSLQILNETFQYSEYLDGISIYSRLK